MNKFFKFLSISILGAMGIACADYYWDIESQSTFSSDYFLQKSLSPFFYNPDESYNGIGHITDYKERFNNIIVEEWSDYFNQKLNKKDLSELLLKDSENEINQIYNAYRDGKSYSKYSSLAAIDKSKSMEFLKYLANAKHAEAYANNDILYDWEGDEKKKKFISNAAFENQLIALYNKTSDRFIKQRYLFQIIRYQYFNKANADIFFEKNKDSFEKNTMYYRTLSYVAGSLKRNGKIYKANYYYSLVFENCEPMKATAHYCFKPQSESDWKGTLSLAKNAKETVTLWAILGIAYGDLERSMREINYLDPKSPYLELLGTRFVQSIENQTNNQFLYAKKNKFSSDKIDAGINKSTSELVYKIAKNGTTTKPYLWNELAAYLSMLRGEYELTPQFLSQAKSTLPNKKVDQSLHRLLEFIYQLSILESIKPSDEAYIFSEITWLKYQTHEKGFYYSMPYQGALMKIAELYRTQNDEIKAQCFQIKNGFYTSDKNVVAIQEFLKKRDKTPYENLLDSLYGYNLDATYEHQAIQLALTNDLKSSLEKAKQMSNSNAKNLLGNPFNNNIKDCHDCDHATYKGKAYTIISLLEKMVTMKSKIDSNIDLYNNSLLLGNAYYNISHYGNARMFSEGEIIGQSYDGYGIDSAYKSILLSMKNAKLNYQSALKSATNDEQRAKCYFLLAKCDRNDWYTKEIFTKYSSEYENNDKLPDFKIWDNFRNLKSYLNTKYAQEVINECGYFKTYLSSKK